MQCSFYVVSYWSASGYRQDWETTGTIDSSHGFCHPRLTVQADDLIFVRVDEAQYNKATLYRVPADDAKFNEFCRKAEEVAGQAVFDRISRIIHAGRQTRRQARQDRELLKGTPHDFDGEWLRPYLVHEWVWVFDKEDGVDVPHSLEQARAMLQSH